VGEFEIVGLLGSTLPDWVTLIILILNKCLYYNVTLYGTEALKIKGKLSSGLVADELDAFSYTKKDDEKKLVKNI